MILTTKGDANTTEDPEPVLVSEAIPREYVVPMAGYLVGHARTDQAMDG